MAACPLCDANVPLPDDVQKSETKDCPECGTGLEVTSLDPVTLAEAPAEDEDWGE